MDGRPSKSFLLTRSSANVEADRNVNFSIQGFDSTAAGRYALRPGDLLAFYVTVPVAGFVATAEIVSESFVDASPIWRPSKTGDAYETRYRSAPRVVVSSEKAVLARHLLDQLEMARYLRDPERWGMLFANAIREIDRADFDTIETALFAVS